MIGYTTLGVNDIDRASQFYDELLALCGASRVIDTAGFILWSTTAEESGLAITKPYDGNKPSVGNGCMVAIKVNSIEKVNEVYHKALTLGAANEGEPGYRADYFYAGYFRDLDGNKLNVFVTQ